uniref:DH domain-containing protein n=1 Tax=Strigamia maritima TaxID=126957 RepID=T1JDF7_STRMM
MKRKNILGKCRDERQSEYKMNRQLGSKNKRGGSGPGSNAEDAQGMVHGHSDSTSRRRTKGFFPTFKSEKLDTLTELLANYDQMGLPDLNCIATFKSNDVDESNYSLENHWNDIVRNGEELPEKVQQQQMALWELLQTEANYINQLQVITNRFKLCLCNLQSEAVLNEIEVDRVFSNIDEIAAVNRLFWLENLKPMLDESRATYKPLNPLKIKDGFTGFANLFHPYIKYCLDRAPCLQYIKDKKRVNELFKAYIAWCETQKECHRQRFNDLSVKPMQRLTKYSLLLKAVFKHTEDDEAKLALSSMVNCVETFVTNVNSTLRQRHEQERLANIINKVESYDVVEAKDEEVQRLVKNHISLDLTCPMPGCKDDQTRQLLLEGDLKLKDATKMDVHCFLFTDMLLITKSLNKKGDRVKIIRQPYVVDRLVVYEMKERTLLLVYLNEFNVATTVFALSGGGDIRHWHECIKKAKEMYSDAKISVKRTPILGYLTTDDVDVDLDFPTHALLTARSPRSSQSSLIHSHSGSMDMSEPSSGCVSHGRAVSLEFADMRASSASSDEGSAADQRARSLEMRVPQPSSPRPERRKQFFKSNSGSNSPNTLSVSYPYSESYDCAELSPTSLLVPTPKTLSPTTRSVTHPPVSPRLLKRGQPLVSPKPPLVKTKNISGEQNSPAPEVASFDFDVPVITTAATTFCPESEEDEAKSKLNQKRVSRTDKRFHTADSIEFMKREKDSNIHKRFSLNYPPNSSSDKLVKNKPTEKYTSSESMYSSSGVSSIGSLHQSTDYELLSETMEDNVEWYETFASLQVPNEPTNGQPMQVDVSEIKDGISSVQIKIQDGNKPVARDYTKMKEFILNDKLLEASEV